jgi:hypothetical protein
VPPPTQTSASAARMARATSPSGASAITSKSSPRAWFQTIGVKPEPAKAADTSAVLAPPSAKHRNVR